MYILYVLEKFSEIECVRENLVKCYDFAIVIFRKRDMKLLITMDKLKPFPQFVYMQCICEYWHVQFGLCNTCVSVCVSASFEENLKMVLLIKRKLNARNKQFFFEKVFFPFLVFLDYHALIFIELLQQKLSFFLLATT